MYNSISVFLVFWLIVRQVSTVNVRHWQDESELARKADQRSLRLRLEQIGANQLLLGETLSWSPFHNYNKLSTQI